MLNGRKLLGYRNTLQANEFLAYDIHVKREMFVSVCIYVYPLYYWASLARDVFRWRRCQELVSEVAEEIVHSAGAMQLTNEVATKAAQVRVKVLHAGVALRKLMS